MRLSDLTVLDEGLEKGKNIVCDENCQLQYLRTPTSTTRPTSY